MKKISVVLIVVLLTIWSVHTTYSAMLISPIEGSVMHVGEKYKVALELDPSEEVIEVIFFANRTEQITRLTTPPFETYFTPQKDIGEDVVQASISFSNGKHITLRRRISIVLADGVTLQSITNANNSAAVIDTDNIDKIGSLYGKYSDGFERELPNIANPVLEFSSDDPSIVEVDNAGKLYSKKLGDTFITIMSGDVTSKLPVSVYAPLNPPKNFKAVATQAEIQLTWELSPNDPKWVTGYQVWRGEYENESQDIRIASLPKGTTSYVDTTAKPNITYYYTVLAASDMLNDISSMNPKQTGKLLTAP